MMYYDPVFTMPVSFVNMYSGSTVSVCLPGDCFLDLVFALT